jgi:hypothetical protein
LGRKTFPAEKVLWGRVAEIGQSGKTLDGSGEAWGSWQIWPVTNLPATAPRKGSRDRRDRRGSLGQIESDGAFPRPLPKSLPISAMKPMVLPLAGPSDGFKKS